MSRPCKGMKGIVEEGEEHIGEKAEDEEAIDSVLIGGGKKVEHYEIAAYTSAHALTEMLGSQVSRLLQQTLAAEEKMDRKLAQLSGRLLKEMVRRAA